MKAIEISCRHRRAGIGASGLAALLVVLFAGCSSKQKVLKPIAQVDTAGAPLVDYGLPPAADGPALTFTVALGSDGNPCTSACAFTTPANAGLELAVAYVAPGGIGIADAPVSYQIQTPGSAAQLSAANTETGADGRASVRLLPAAGALGLVEVAASVPIDPAAGRLIFRVEVTAGADPVLIVSLKQQGTAPVNQVQVRLFRVTGSANPKRCADLESEAVATPPVPDFASDPIAPHQQATFVVLPGLAEAKSQEWTVQAVGPPTGSPLALGCLDGVQVAVGTTKEVEVVLKDLLLLLAGRYRVNTTVDLVNGLPDGTAKIVNGILKVFTEPGQVVIPLACAGVESLYKTACNVLLDDQDPTGLSAVGKVVAAAAKNALLDLLEQALGEQVMFTGQALESILKELRIRSSLNFEAEPGEPDPETGLRTFPERSVSEVWETGWFRFPFKASCDITDPECGWFCFDLAEVYGLRPETRDLDVSVGSGNTLHVASHRVQTFTYGPLVNHVVERKVLPAIFGDGETCYEPWEQIDCEGVTFDQRVCLPAVNSYDKLVSTLLGDKCCLALNDCCEYFAERIYPYVDELIYAVAPSLCEAAIPAAAGLLRNQIKDLSGPMTVGTPEDAACPARAEGSARQAGFLGSEGNPCSWEMSFDIGGSEFRPQATFRGIRMLKPSSQNPCED